MLNLQTLGLPATPKPQLKKPHTAPAPHFLHQTYAAHILAQLLESTAQKVEVGSKYFQQTGLHKRAERLHAGADAVLDTLFGDFTSSEATMLNNLTNACEGALASVIAIALAPQADDAKLNRAHDLLTELAELAGIKIA